IRAVGGADRTHRGRPTDALGELGVRHRGAARDGAQGAPHLALKVGARRLYRQRLDRRELAGEIAADRARDVRRSTRLQSESTRAVLAAEIALQAVLEVEPADGAQSLRAVG